MTSLQRLFRQFVLNEGHRRSRVRRPSAELCGMVDSLEARLVLTPYAQFGFGVIASNLDLGQNTFFGSADPLDRPYSEINFGQVEFYSLSGIDVVAAGVGNVGDLQIMFGSTNTADAPVLTLESFDDGLGDGIANQVFTHSGGSNENAITLLNDGVSVAEGTLDRLEVETTPEMVSTAFGSITFTAAVGADTAVFDEIMNVTGSTGSFNFDTGEFDTDGTIVFDVDGSLFLSTGVGVFGQPADLASLGYIPIDLDADGNLNIHLLPASPNAFNLGITSDGNPVLADANGTLDDQLLDLGLVSGRIQVFGGSDVDDFGIISINGNPLPVGGLHFDGGGQPMTGNGDGLQLLGGPVKTVRHNVLGVTDGQIEITLNDMASTRVPISYTDVDGRVIDSLPSNRTTFSYGSTSDVITLTERLSGDVFRLTSSTAPTFEFDLPSVVVVDGGPGRDFISINNLHSGLGPSTYIINGGDGPDRLAGSTSSRNLVLVGGSGSDCLMGGTGNDVLRGGAGNDILIGGEGNDRLFGQGSTGDRLKGGSGNDFLDGGTGKDALYEAADADFVLTASTLTGLGTDQVRNLERVHLRGGDSNNLIDASAFTGNVVLRGLDGDDTLIGGVGDDKLFGGLGDDVLRGMDGRDSLYGEVGNDTLDGGSGNDRLYGRAGSDLLLGGAGRDQLLGGAGPDELAGGAGDDSLYGHAGNDLLRGGAGGDVLRGESGDDVLLGQGGSGDKLRGGSGADTIDSGAGRDRIVTDGLDSIVMDVLDTVIGPAA